MNVLHEQAPEKRPWRVGSAPFNWTIRAISAMRADWSWAVTGKQEEGREGMRNNRERREGGCWEAGGQRRTGKWSREHKKHDIGDKGIFLMEGSRARDGERWRMLEDIWGGGGLPNECLHEIIRHQIPQKANCRALHTEMSREKGKQDTMWYKKRVSV